MATSYNTDVFIKNFMKSIMNTTYPNFEVLIIDDHSTDGSYEWLLESYVKNSKVRIIRNAKNLRLGKSRTKGVKLSRGKYVTFMDVDTIVDKDWISESVKTLEENDSISAVQSVVFDLLEPKIISSGGLKMVREFGWVFAIDQGKKKLSNQNELTETFPGITGILYRKEIFKTVGYFDYKIGFNIDDVDFGLRVYLSGFRVFVNPKAITYHITVKPKKEREKVIKRLEWEFQFMKMPRIMIKNYEVSSLLFSLPSFLAVGLIRSFRWLIEGEYRPFLGFVWATAWNVYELQDTFRERRRIQKLRKISDNEIFRRIGAGHAFSPKIIKRFLKQIKMTTLWAKRVKKLPSAQFLLK